MKMKAALMYGPKRHPYQKKTEKPKCPQDGLIIKIMSGACAALTSAI